MIGDALCLWVIFKYPADFPQHYVVRCQYATGNGVAAAPVAGLYDSLEEARFDVPDGRYRMGRHLLDDPAIVESWF